MKKIWKKVIKYGTYLDKVGKVLLVIPSLKVVSIIVMAIDAVFDASWAAIKKKELEDRIENAKGKTKKP